MRCIVFASVLVGLASAAIAQEPPSAQRVQALLAGVSRGGNTYEDALAYFSRAVRVYDRNGDGLTDDELDVADSIARAMMRAQTAAGMLPADLNNDLRVTREEIEIVSRVGRNGLEFRQFDKADRNGDGVVEWSEMTMADREGQTSEKSQIRRSSLDLDPTPETPYTLADASALADELFDLADNNHDRLIDTQERRHLQEVLSTQVRPARPGSRVSDPGQACNVPRPQATDEVVVIGAYEGVSYSSSHVGAVDEPTYVVDVAIAAGEKPIYLIASSYESVIWRFTGATGRVRQALLAGYEPQAAIGVPKAVVAFTGRNDCFRSAYRFDDFKGIAAKASIAAFAGRDDVHFAGDYALYSVAVPDMIVVLPPASGKRFDNPVAQVQASAVVAEAPVEPYQVLPGRAGLAQLLASGAIEPMGDDAFRIVKPIPHFPADLAGAHSVRFLVGKGVPLPAGKPGHSCVVMEETGETAGTCHF